MTKPADTAGQESTLAEALESRGFERISRPGATAWEGKHQGRDAIVAVSRQSRTRYAGEIRSREHLGYRLRIELGTVVRTRLFFVNESATSSSIIRWIYRWRRQAVVEQVPPELEGFRVVAVDEPYAERLLSERNAMAHVGHLSRDGASATLTGSVYLFLGTVHYGSPILQENDITTERVLDVICRLDEIAQAAERIQPPTVVGEQNRIESFIQRRPVATALLFVGGCLLALMMLMIVAVRLAT